MPVSTITSKGQMTLPKEIRKSLNLKPSDKVVIWPEHGFAVMYPLKGNILDIGGSIRIPGREKPIRFEMVREETAKHLGERRRGEKRK